MTATLGPAQAGVGGSGAAALILDNVSRTLVSAVTFEDLTRGTVSAAIVSRNTGDTIHTFPDVPIGVTSGSFTDLWTGVLPDQIVGLTTQQYAIRIRTSDSPSSGVGGTITVVPEPASAVMGASAALMGLGYAWRRRRRAVA